MTQKEAIEVYNSLIDTKIKEAFEFFAPELRQSEDESERIRKYLLRICEECIETNERGLELSMDTTKKLATYLKKQKKQKPAKWDEDYNEENLQTRFAFYTYKDEPGVLFLSNLFVEEASRNRGLGTKILKAAEKVAKTIGASLIELKVKQDSPANAWYRKNGYRYVSSENGYNWRVKPLKSI